MSTPFDQVVENILKSGYHNHRREEHSDIVSEGIFSGLVSTCPALRRDFETGAVCYWTNVPAPGARNRKIDLFIGEPGQDGTPEIKKLRICVENKSVITAHRNRDSRFDDLNETMQVVHFARPEAVMVATVMIGVAPQTLNVPDRITPMYKGARQIEFSEKVLPRLCSGDVTLWDDYPHAVSVNRKVDPSQTLARLRGLPTRPPGFTHMAGYDYIMFAPMYIDNVHSPYVARENDLGINVDGEYSNMLQAICRAYTARWHT